MKMRVDSIIGDVPFAQPLGYRVMCLGLQEDGDLACVVGSRLQIYVRPWGEAEANQFRIGRVFKITMDMEN